MLFKPPISVRWQCRNPRCRRFLPANPLADDLCERCLHASYCVDELSYPCRHHKAAGHGKPVCDWLPRRHTVADHATAYDRPWLAGR